MEVKRPRLCNTSESGESSSSYSDFSEDFYFESDFEADNEGTSGLQDRSYLSHDLFSEYMENEVNLIEEETNGRQTLLTIPTPQNDLWMWKRELPTCTKTPFDLTTAGWTTILEEDKNELDFFNLMFPQQCLDMIVEETNVYATLIIGEKPELTRRDANLQEFTRDDIMRYIAVRIIMGIDHKPEYTDYWSKDEFLRSSFVPKIMTSNRFFEVQAYLHFSTNEDPKGDKLHKVRRLWDMVISNFQNQLKPFENISVDESLVKFKGALGIKQFIPSKRNRFGVKTFSVVDQQTGFILNSTIYEGKTTTLDDPQKKDYGYGGAVLVQLCRPYLNANRRVFCDNYFTSPLLAKFLLENQTYMCGTLRSKRKNAPDVPKLAKDEMAVFHINNEVMIEYWRDKKVVRMISTGYSHEVNVCGKTKPKLKPETVDHYNKNAGGIDSSDASMHTYDSSRKTNKWSNRIFFRTIEMAIYNAFKMMKSQRGGSSTILKFKKNLTHQIIEATGGFIDTRKTTSAVLTRATNNHFPGELDSKRRCVLCTKQKVDKRSKCCCNTCGVPLCVYPCFEIYHLSK